MTEVHASCCEACLTIVRREGERLLGLFSFVLFSEVRVPWSTTGNILGHDFAFTYGHLYKFMDLVTIPAQ